ncbi:MAG: homoserine kinase [Nitrososphaerota archaeon]|jgi:homoserine kinase|nr:homoserine kinase [Nitrososphaerota archaeon]MDG6932066.1 homoserine kinase [Nitrososphaerota archaeon]MDG6944557.1 homoserine kinase [Nitrososphaerota archaeon]
MKPSRKRVKVRAYSSSANLSAGFDTAAVALDAFYDEVEMAYNGSDKINSTVTGMGEVPAENTATIAAREVFERAGTGFGIDVKLIKGIPAGRGLGSSGASAAAGAFAANLMINSRLDLNELVDIAAKAEGAFSGTPHADNVSASLLGGFSFVYSKNPFNAFSIYRNMRFYVAIPDVKISESKTKKARASLGQPVDFAQYVNEKYALIKLVKGVLYGDYADIAAAINEDSYHQKMRAGASLIPFFDEIKAGLISNGADGVCLSGAGPSLLILSSNENFESVIAKIYGKFNISVTVKKTEVAGGVYEII